MRGKLRDKRTAAKRDTFKREVIERRRPNKRETRATIQQSLQMNDDDFELDFDDFDDEIDDEEDAEEAPVQTKSPQKK